MFTATMVIEMYAGFQQLNLGATSVHLVWDHALTPDPKICNDTSKPCTLKRPKVDIRPGNLWQTKRYTMLTTAQQGRPMQP